MSREEFEWVYTDQPHTNRRKEILGEDLRPVMCARRCAGPAWPPARAPGEQGLRGPFQPLRCSAAGGCRRRGCCGTLGGPEAGGMEAFASPPPPRLTPTRVAGPSMVKGLAGATRRPVS